MSVTVRTEMTERERERAVCHKYHGVAKLRSHYMVNWYSYRFFRLSFKGPNTEQRERANTRAQE